MLQPPAEQSQCPADCARGAGHNIRMSLSNDDRPFVLRLVRFIAIVGIFCSAILLIRDTYVFRLNGPRIFTFYSIREWIRYPLNSLFAASILNNAFLGVASAGLLLMRRWGRLCMLIWAVLAIAIDVANHTSAFLQVHTYYRQHPNKVIGDGYIFW